MNRRELLKKAILVPGGAAALLTLEQRILLARESSGADKHGTGGDLPTGKIGKLNISRLICGGNLISGFAHSRDLVYVSSLLKRYFTDDKIFQTLRLCEESGENTAILRLDSMVIGLINKYRKECGGKIQWIAQVKPKPDDLTTDAGKAIDNGAAGIYVQGGVGDRFLKQGRVDLFGKFLEFGRKNNVITGIGSHSVEVPMACEKAGIKPDFYMKTLHHSRYWSFNLENVHDNVWSRTPEKTIEFMEKVETPWIAFKCLAAGAISPTAGFKYAFSNGADFICVGMFDFQVRDDVQIARGLLSKINNRKRPWRA